mgnify:CR=1 FL=1
MGEREGERERGRSIGKLRERTIDLEGERGTEGDRVGRR